jgi:hypothetical protein
MNVLGAQSNRASPLQDILARMKLTEIPLLKDGAEKRTFCAICCRQDC